MALSNIVATLSEWVLFVFLMAGGFYFWFRGIHNQSKTDLYLGISINLLQIPVVSLSSGAFGLFAMGISTILYGSYIPQGSPMKWHLLWVGMMLVVCALMLSAFI